MLSIIPNPRTRVVCDIAKGQVHVSAPLDPRRSGVHIRKPLPIPHIHVAPLVHFIFPLRESSTLISTSIIQGRQDHVCNPGSDVGDEEEGVREG